MSAYGFEVKLSARVCVRAPAEVLHCTFSAAAMLSAPSPSHESAEFLSRVLEQNLNLSGTTLIYGAELPTRPTGLVQPNTLPAEDVDRVFGTYGALAFAGLGQPEIGVRVVCRSGIQIEIKLERNMFRLKVRVAPLDHRNKNPSDPLCAVLECGGGRPLMPLR